MDNENHDRWLVSYADYVTLLFAFFVMMFASSHADLKKAARVSESVQRAYVGDRTRYRPSTEIVDTKHPVPRDPNDNLLPSFEVLSKELATEIENGKVWIHLESRGLVISLTETAFFEPGAETIAPDAGPAIHKIADALRSLPNSIRLEGHTDSTPIRTARYPSNWHLSSARALAMLDFMTQKCGLPLKRFAVAGYSDTVPVDTNETAEGRARNRRVDVVILTVAPSESVAEKATGGGNP